MASMASGLRFGARFCCNASSSSFSRASRINLNTSRYLWKCRQVSVVDTVLTKRFYANEKSSRVSGGFPSWKFSQYLKSENVINAEVDAEVDTDGPSGSDGELDDEDPSIRMKSMVVRYEKYKRWLANLMGEDPETFTPEDVQKAVEYLMPSGLYAKDCRPKFEHPEVYYKLSTEQAALIDEHGRPTAAAFYTGQVAFHNLLFEIYEQIALLNSIDEQKRLEEAELSKSDATAAEMNSSDSDTSAAENESFDSDSSAAENSSFDSDTIAAENMSFDTGTTAVENSSFDRDTTAAEKSLDSDTTAVEDISFDSGTTAADKNLTDSDTTAAEDMSASSDDSESHSSDVESSDGSDTKESQVDWTRQKMKWISKLELEREINDSLSDRDYEVILHRLKKLAKHRQAHHAYPFLLRFLRVIPTPGTEEAEKKLNEKGEAYGEVTHLLEIKNVLQEKLTEGDEKAIKPGHTSFSDRKNAIARVWVKRGTGNVTVNDVPFVKYFARMEDRKQIMSPFLAINAVGDYNVKSEVIGGGHSGQSGAIRLAISRALLHFEDSYRQALLEARLLIKDPRTKERKKPGRKRARKKFTWVRR